MNELKLGRIISRRYIYELQKALESMAFVHGRLPFRLLSTLEHLEYARP